MTRPAAATLPVTGKQSDEKTAPQQQPLRHPPDSSPRQKSGRHNVADTATADGDSPRVVAKTAGESDVLDDFDFANAPFKSISVSALDDLPQHHRNVSFVGPIDSPNNTEPGEIDTDEISVLAEKVARAPTVAPDDSALDSFFKKLPPR